MATTIRRRHLLVGLQHKLSKRLAPMVACDDGNGNFEGTDDHQILTVGTLSLLGRRIGTATLRLMINYDGAERVVVGTQNLERGSFAHLS